MLNTMNQDKCTNTLYDLINSFSALRKRNLLLIASTLREDITSQIYNILQELNSDFIDVILITSGGQAAIARKVGLMLRKRVRSLSFFVPSVARSAGTLLCLSGDEVFMSDLSELGSIDNITRVSLASDGVTNHISSEDIRQFMLMANDWFSVTSEKNGFELLDLFSKKIFLPTMTTMYRTDSMVRAIALELLHFQLPSKSLKLKKQIIDKLITSFYVHEFGILFDDAVRLGLNVKKMSHEEQKITTEIVQEVKNIVTPNPSLLEYGVLGLLVSNKSYLEHTFNWEKISEKSSLDNNFIQTNAWRKKW